MLWHGTVNSLISPELSQRNTGAVCSLLQTSGLFLRSKERCSTSQKILHTHHLVQSHVSGLWFSLCKDTISAAKTELLSVCKDRNVVTGGAGSLWKGSRQHPASHRACSLPLLYNTSCLNTLEHFRGTRALGAEQAPQGPRV